MRKLYLLNTSILPNYGVYKFEPISLEVAKELIKNNPNFISAIGHTGTAELLSTLLGIIIPVNRIAIKMDTGDKAIVLKLKFRLEESKILSLQELIELYNNNQIEFGILEKIN